MGRQKFAVRNGTAVKKYIPYNTIVKYVSKIDEESVLVPVLFVLFEMHD
jgi:hypothetical protein